MRFWGTVALRCVNSEELTPLERMTANEWGIEPAVSATSGQPVEFQTGVVRQSPNCSKPSCLEVFDRLDGLVINEHKKLIEVKFAKEFDPQ